MGDLMSKRYILLAVLLLLAIPTLIYAYGVGGYVDKVIITTEDFGDVTFSHMRHSAFCSDCHTKIFQQKANSTPKVGMKAMEEGKSCGNCHNDDYAFSVKGSCSECHTGVKDILFKEEDAGNVTFPHSTHLEMFSCSDCHPDLFKAKRGANKATMDEMAEGSSCGACHDGDSAFGVEDDEGCESCHQM